MPFRKPHTLSTLSLSLVLPALALWLGGCKVSNPDEHNEEELITTVRLVYTDTLTQVSDTVFFRDADGPGGDGPSAHDTIRLSPSRIYRVVLSFLDESDAGNVVDITEEIREEADDHQVFFTVSGANLAVAYGDEDANGLPLGLETLQTAGAASTGTMTVTLKHQPGLKGPGSTIATGETDVEVAFQARIE